MTICTGATVSVVAAVAGTTTDSPSSSDSSRLLPFNARRNNNYWL